MSSKLDAGEIARRYQAGESTNTIADDAGITPRSIRRILNRAGIGTSHRSRPPKYRVDVDFFKRWSPEMAYVFGFILTDGHIQGNALIIAQRDRYILDKIAAVMSSDYLVKKRDNGSSSIYLLNITRKQVVDDLRRLGITESKSRTVAFPNVPEEYTRHFLRGVIDGDGWVHERGYVVNVTSGSALFAQGLHAEFQRRGFNGRLDDCGGVYRVWVSGKNDVARLCQWLYEDCGELFLPRKYERFSIHVA